MNNSLGLVTQWRVTTIMLLLSVLLACMVVWLMLWRWCEILIEWIDWHDRASDHWLGRWTLRAVNCRLIIDRWRAWCIAQCGTLRITTANVTDVMSSCVEWDLHRVTVYRIRGPWEFGDKDGLAQLVDIINIIKTAILWRRKPSVIRARAWILQAFTH